MEHVPQAFPQIGRYPVLRRLWPADAIALRDHLLRIGADNGAAAADGYEMTRRILDHDWSETVILGAFEGDLLRGVAEFSSTSRPVIAVTVEACVNHRGLGTQLLDRVLVLARGGGISFAELICLPENGHLMQCADRLGAVILSQTGNAATAGSYLSCLPATGAQAAMLELDGARLIA